MARVNIEEVVDHLSPEIRRALAAAVEECAPDADIDAHELFRAFKRAVRRKCSTWETVPDNCVEKGLTTNSCTSGITTDPARLAVQA